MLELNISQDLFLILFSILYAVMLENVRGIQPFPLGRTLRGYVKGDGSVEAKLKGLWRRRVALSFAILNVLPILYLWGILRLLGEVTISAELLLTDLGVLSIVFWSTLGVFGFYRVYLAIAVSKWGVKYFFRDVIARLEEREGSFDPKAHLIWGVLFYLSPGLSYLIVLSLRPAFLFLWLLFLIAIIVVIIAYCITD